MFGACHTCKGCPLNRDGQVVSFMFHLFIFFSYLLCLSTFEKFSFYFFHSCVSFWSVHVPIFCTADFYYMFLALFIFVFVFFLIFMLVSIPIINLILIASWMQYWFVNVLFNCVNISKISEDLLSTFYFFLLQLSL